MDIIMRQIGDELGPEQILLIRQPRVGLEAMVVVNNTACGPEQKEGVVRTFARMIRTT